ncbi:MAG: hypothetical protein Ct9H90mP2_04640 [Dehalococcoidia bacterium]|nr:MAG: hypothetical protein Ct9H90mP2_04640 [Dehalococcoidia bacterium]
MQFTPYHDHIIPIHGSHDHDDGGNDHHDQSILFLHCFLFLAKSFIIGLIHGMAGSARYACNFTNHTKLFRVFFLILFRGTMLSMSIMTIILACHLDKFSESFRIILLVLWFVSIPLGLL